MTNNLAKYEKTLPIVCNYNNVVLSLIKNGIDDKNDIYGYGTGKVLGKSFNGSYFIQLENGNMLEQFLSFPLRHYGSLTLKHILETIPDECYHDYDLVYLRCKYIDRIDGFHISMCYVLADVSVKEKKYHHVDVNQKIPPEILQERYDRCIPIDRISDKWYTIKKREIGSPYLWYSEGNKINEIEKISDREFSVNNATYQKVLSYPTFHIYSCPNFFKASLKEVLCQVPKEIKLNDFLVTTDYLDRCGNYHIGVTIVYERTDPPNKKRKIVE